MPDYGRKVELCSSCHSLVHPVQRHRGSGWIEAILWLSLFLWIGGLLYSIWRRSGGAFYDCPKCGKETMPLNTPAATYIMEREKIRIPGTYAID